MNDVYFRKFLKDNNITPEYIIKSVDVLHNICNANIYCTGCLFYSDGDCILRDFKNTDIIETTEQLLDKHINCGYMSRIAKMLSLTIDEPFGIYYNGAYLSGCKLTDEGLTLASQYAEYSADVVFHDLLIGKAKVMHKGDIV